MAFYNSEQWHQCYFTVINRGLEII